MLSIAACRCAGIHRVALGGRQDQAGTEALRQDEDVAGLRAGLRDQPVRVADAHDGQPVLGLRVDHGVAAGDDAARLRHLVGATGEHVRQDRRVHAVREAGDVQAQHYLSTHGVDVAHGVGGSDGAVRPGVVYHGREEVQRHDHGRLVVQLVDGSIVRHTGEQARVVLGAELLDQGAQDLRQQAGARPYRLNQRTKRAKSV